MSILAIERGVPMPRTRRPLVRYPFPSMQVGDSFRLPVEGEDFSCHIVEDRAAVRVWRVPA